MPLRTHANYLVCSAKLLNIIASLQFQTYNMRIIIDKFPRTW